MSQTIDNQIVKMQFDNTGFEKGAQQSISTLDKLKQALHFDKVNMTPLQQAFAETEATATKAGFSIRDIWVKVASTIEDQVANKIVEAGKKVFNALSLEGVTDGFKEYELKMGSIQTIMAGTGESLATVNRYLEELNTYSDQTIYSFSDMTNNIGKFTNAGVKLKDAVAAIKGIANEAAVSGANANEASRAMYNFSQALSAGFVKLIDWKSIENANMATKEFKQTLIDVAQGIGTLVKVGDDWQSTTTNAQGKVSDLFNATKGFNDSLNNQWMTTEALTGALKIYATNIKTLSDEEIADYEKELREVYHLNEDQIIQYEQLGIKAAASATEIKTFTMLIDTLKEAIGSGWAMTWQYFIGDFEQAKSLFTQVGNTLGGMIDQMSASRNAFIKSGLQTGWEKFTTIEGMAIPESEEFRKVLLDVAKAHGVLSKEQLVDIVSTEKLVESFHTLGWVTGDLLTESVSDYVNILKRMSDEERASAGITDEQMRQLEKMNETLSDTANGGKELADEYAKAMNELGGRENIIEGLRNMFHSLKDSITPIGEAFSNVFGLMDPMNLYNLTKRFKEFTDQMKVSEDAAGTIRTAFTLAFGGIKTVIGGVTTAINGLLKLVLPVFNLFDAIFGLIGKVVAAFTGSKGALEAADKFTKVGDKIGSKYIKIMQKLGDTIDAVANAIRGVPESTVFVKINESVVKATEAVKDFVDSFVKMPVIQQMISDFNKTVENIQKKLEPVAKYVSKTLDDVKKKISAFFTFDSLNKNLTTIYNKVTKFFDLLKSFATRVKTFFTDLKEGKSLIESFKDNFGDIIDKIKELKENVTDFFKSLFEKGDEMEGQFDLKKIQEAIHDFVTNITPDQITMIAVAGTFMLIAMNLLRLSNALRDAVDAFTGIGVAIKNVINSYVKKQKSTILQIAESIVIVAAALWVLAQVPKDQLENAVGALKTLVICLGALTIVLTACGAAMAHLGKGESMVKLASSLAIIAGSFMAAALSLKVLEYVDIKGVIPKVLMVTAILGILTGLSFLIKKLDKFSRGALTIVTLAGALFITAASLERIGSISSENLDKSMSILLKLMLGLAAITYASGKVGILSAVGLIGVILALDKIIPAIERLVNYDYSSINKGLQRNEEMVKKLGGIIAVIVAVGAIAGNRIKGTALALLALSATFGIMLGISKLAGQMKPSELARGEAFLFKMGVILSMLELFSSKSRLQMFGGKNGGDGSKVFTRIAITMGILLGIAKLASMMKPAALIKGELALVGLVGIVELMSFVAKRAKGSEGTFKAVTTMLFAVSAILGMVGILSIIPMEHMKPTLVAVLSIIGALALMAIAISKNITIFNKAEQAKASSIIPLGIAMIMVGVLAHMMREIAKEDPKNVITAAASLVSIIGAISLFSKAFSKIKLSNGDGQLGVFVAAVVMMALAGAAVFCLSAFLKKFNIDTNTVLSAAGAIAIVLAGLSPALYAMSNFKTGDTDLKTAGNVILMAIGALVGVAGSIFVLSKFGGDTNKMIAGAIAISIGLIALCAPIAVLGAVGNFVEDIDVIAMWNIVAASIVALAGVSAALIAVTNMVTNPDNLINSAKALAIGLVAISVPISVLGVVGKLCSGMKAGGVGSMAVAIIGSVAALWGISKVLVDFAKNIDMAGIERLNAAIPALITAVGAVGVLALAISAAGLLAGGQFMVVAAGGAAITLAIVTLAEIIMAIALLGAAIENSAYHGEALEKGLDTMVIIFNKLGEAVGALISGFGKGLTTNLDDMADRLNSFSEKMVPFCENMKSISSEAIDGCKNLAGAMFYLGAANFLDALGRIIGFGNVTFDFGALGEAIVSFAQSVSGLPEDAISKADLCSRIAKKLIEVEGALEAKGGLAGLIFGEKDLAGFATGVGNFGTAIKKFCEAVSGIPENAVQLAQNAADAAGPMIELTQTLVSTGGIWQHIVGEKDLKAFSSSLIAFATGLIGFVSSLVILDGQCPTYVELIQKCADATTPMVDLANSLENMGGSLSQFTGDNTLDKFGETLVPFATGLKEFIAEVASMAKDNPNFVGLIIQITNTSSYLVTLANSLENMGGVASWFSGDNTLKKFGDHLKKFGKSLKEFVDEISDMTFLNLDSFCTEVEKLLALSKEAITAPADAFVVLNENIETLSKMPIQTIAAEWAANTPGLIDTITATLNQIVALISIRTANDKKDYTNYGTNIPTSISEGVSSEESTELLILTFSNMVELIKQKLDEWMSSEVFETYGLNVVTGISDGIDKNQDPVITKAEELAKKISETIANALQIHSPSRVTYEFGKYIDEGLANGINDYSTSVIDSTENMSNSIVTMANNIITAITAAISNDMDMQPTIRPVLDTTDLVRGARKVGSLFSNSDLSMAYGISGSVKESQIAKYGNATIMDSQNGPVGGTQINFTQNNYSPKELSRMDIYRQTRNQLNMMKGVVKANA